MVKFIRNQMQVCRTQLLKDIKTCNSRQTDVQHYTHGMKQNKTAKKTNAYKNPSV